MDSAAHGGDTLVCITVAEDDAGRRLDQLLARRFPDHSRAEAKRWIEDGRVEVQGLGPLKPKTALAAGAVVRVRIPPERTRELLPEPLDPALGAGTSLRVLHDDAHVLVIDKPAGLVVHPSPGHEGGTLVNALLYAGGGLSREGGDERPGLVHRLDRDTSGVMVIARTDGAHRELARQFKAREVDKVYLAIARGAPRERRTTVDRPIGRSRNDRKRMAVCEDGRPAHTVFEVEERLGPYAVIRCFPKTGRTHQIRVHLHALGAPILCDGLYAPQAKVVRAELEGRARRDKDDAPLLERHALHAERLTFTHPGSGERASFAAPLPQDLERVIAVLRERYGGGAGGAR